MIELSENILKFITALIGIIAAAITIFSVINYDSFDRKLMPRNKSTITLLKQVTGVFLIIIPIYMLISYFLAYYILSIHYLRVLAYYFIDFLSILYILSMLIKFLEWCYRKLKRFNTSSVFVKLELLFRFNDQWFGNLLFICIFAFTTVIADIHLTTTKTELLSIQMLYEVLFIALVMGILSILLLMPLYLDNKTKKYYLLHIQSETQLLDELGTHKMYLEYFLNDTVTIYSAANHQYKIIKRIHAEGEPQYEVYKVEQVNDKPLNN